MGLVAYWPLDESAGPVLDYAGANDGTVTGATPEATGIAGTSAYSFDGVDDYITLPSDILDTAPFSMFVWARPTDVTTDQHVFAMRNDVNSLLRVGYTSGQWTWWDGSNTDFAPATASEYAFVGAVVEADNTLRLYHNGQETAVGTWSGSAGNRVNVIGTDAANLTDKLFDGEVDDVRVYDHALTAQEVSYLYEAVTEPSYTFTETLASASTPALSVDCTLNGQTATATVRGSPGTPSEESQTVTLADGATEYPISWNSSHTEFQTTINGTVSDVTQSIQVTEATVGEAESVPTGPPTYTAAPATATITNAGRPRRPTATPLSASLSAYDHVPTFEATPVTASLTTATETPTTRVARSPPTNVYGYSRVDDPAAAHTRATPTAALVDGGFDPVTARPGDAAAPTTTTASEPTATPTAGAQLLASLTTLSPTNATAYVATAGPTATAYPATSIGVHDVATVSGDLRGDTTIPFVPFIATPLVATATAATHDRGDVFEGHVETATTTDAERRRQLTATAQLSLRTYAEASAFTALEGATLSSSPTVALRSTDARTATPVDGHPDVALVTAPPHVAAGLVAMLASTARTQSPRVAAQTAASLTSPIATDTSYVLATPTTTLSDVSLQLDNLVATPATLALVDGDVTQATPRDGGGLTAALEGPPSVIKTTHSGDALVTVTTEGVYVTTSMLLALIHSDGALERTDEAARTEYKPR